MVDFSQPYTRFAFAYDKMMENVDYTRWSDYIDRLFTMHNYHPKRVLDIACGTGSATVLLAQKGYDMAGTDRAREMLFKAREKAEKLGLYIPFWQQDMRYLSVSSPYDAVICLYDSINYMITQEDMSQVFQKVSESLVPKGMFIFDITTEYNIIKHFHLKTFAETEENFSYIWRNIYLQNEKICKTVLTFFLKEGGKYEKYEELHIQKIFSVSELKDLLEQNGYKMLSAFECFTFNKWNRNSERINITAVKRQ